MIRDGLKDGLFTIFSSDHAPFRYDGDDGKKPEGAEEPFGHIPNGIPGIETWMPLPCSEGVPAGRNSIHRFVDLTATQPAKLYGLYPRQGSFAIGTDADVVIWDERPHTITNAALHHNVDCTPCEGMTLRAWPGLTLSQGEVVWNGQQLLSRPGQGRFLPCGMPSIVPVRAEPSARRSISCRH